MLNSWRQMLKRTAFRFGMLGFLRQVRARLWPINAPDYAEIAKTGSMPLPSSATFEPTIGCNLHCPMCYQNDLRAGVFQDAPAHQVVSLFDRLSGSIRSVYLIGGEIFIRKDVFEILDSLEQHCVEFFITTNGTLLNADRLKKLSGYRMFVGMGVSLDGTEAIHDSIRGPGTFKKSIEALRLAASLFRVGVNSVLMPENLSVAADLMRVVAGIGVKEMNFTYEMFCSEQDAVESANGLRIDRRDIAMQTKPDSTAVTTGPEIELVIDTIERLARELGMVVTFEPPVPRDHLASLFSGRILDEPSVVCRVMTDLRVDPNGNVLPCGFIRKSFGNVFQQPVEEIWNSEEFRKFRRMLLGGNLLPVCKRCCKLGVSQASSATAEAAQPANYV